MKHLPHPNHLDFVRQLPCCVCGNEESWRDRQPHHLIADRHARQKAPDHEVVPLCPPHHDGLHAMGDEALYFAGERATGRPKVASKWLAGALYGVSGDYSRGVECIAMARRAA